MNRIWNSIDRWGPGVVAVATLAALIALSWIYSSRLSYQQGRIDSLESQLSRSAIRENQNWQLVETYRLEVQALRVETAKLTKGE